MDFYSELKTRDGRELILRNAVGTDAADFLDYFIQAHSETEYLTTYPDETKRNVANTTEDLEATRASERNIEICAFVDGRLVGSAGIELERDRDKTRHRASFGISILRDYWGLGIGSLLTESCIEVARRAGYLQIELDVVAENEAAVALYKKYGFTEFGRNPRAFRTRQGRWQEVILMRLEL